MTKSLRIAVADDEPDVLEFYQIVLAELGHEVVCTARDGKELVERCRNNRPELLIIDVKMPNLDGIDAVKQLAQDDPIPAIIVSGYHDPETLKRAEMEYILAYLIKPIREADLEVAINIAMRRFEQFQSLRSEAASLRQAVEDRKVIVRATRALMKYAGTDEQQAFQRLQEMARSQDRPLVEVAKTVEAAYAAKD